VIIVSVEKAFVGFHQKYIIHDAFAQAARKGNGKESITTIIHKPIGM